jgi:chromate reductase
MRILAISGSLRSGSHNAMLLRAAAELLPPTVELDLLEPGLLRAIPHYDEDLHALGEPPAVASLRRRVAGADALLLSTPEYNHSLPGALKNALDWLSRPLSESPFRGKEALVLGTSTGMFGAVWAQAELRKVLGAVGARVVDAELPLPHAGELFGHDGVLADADARDALAEHLRLLPGVGAGERLVA